MAAGQELDNSFVASRMSNREQVIRLRTNIGLVRPLYPCPTPALLEKVAHVTATSSTLWSSAMAEQESFRASGSSPPANPSQFLKSSNSPPAGVGRRLLEGYIDPLYRGPDGLVVVDYKTSGSDDSDALDRRIDELETAG